MNKIKFALVSLALVLGFTACNKNDYEYTPGKVAGEKALFFDDEENLTMALTDNEIEITLNRADAEGELTVPLKVLVAPDFVTVPSTATFAAGEDQTTIKLAIGEDMQPFTKYLVKISIPEEYTQPYSEDAGSPVYSFTILKEDWAKIADGVFTSTVALTGSWGQELQYSEYMNLYRFTDLFVEDANVYFHYDGFIQVTEKTAEGNDTTYVKEDFYFTDASGKHIKKFSIGYTHPTYGLLSANINESYPMGYEESVDKETGEPVYEFYWVWSITIPDGRGFGENYQFYDVTEWVKKPWEKDVE
jgi:hypothetical protein